MGGERENTVGGNVRRGRRMGGANWRRCSNLQRFLDRTTPVVPLLSLPKISFRELNSLWQPTDQDMVEYFTLGDLWDQYYEPSIYGAGVPITLDNCETVDQYYVPYLSAIQIYTSKSLAATRNMGEDSESDTWSNDSEGEKLSRSWDGVSEDSASEQDALWPTRDRIGHLYLQYFGYGSPYDRVPLVNKVYELAKSYPGLTSFKSVEISPASWISVAWYPIYHIPTRGDVKDLSTSFLTYHTISSSFQDNISGDEQKGACDVEVCKDERKLKESRNCISLPPLGLSTYKMQGSLWMNPETSDHETLIKLYSAADSWLKQLRVQHHDFDFFLTHPM